MKGQRDEGTKKRRLRPLAPPSPDPFADPPLADGSVEHPLIVFAGGGTGGHLYPALAIAGELRRRLPGARLLFFGTQRQIDRRILEPLVSPLARGEGGVQCDLVQQTLPPLRRAPWSWAGTYMGFRRSSLSCRSRFQADPPAVVIGTGGLSSVPAVREAARAGIPTALLNPDALPGRANRYLAAKADLVFAQWEETIRHLPCSARVLVCGCAVRPGFNHAGREAGIERFGLDPDRKTLLVTGASQGARTLNRAVLANLEYLESARTDWQVLHLTGDHDYEEVRRAYDRRTIRAAVVPFTEHMADALGAADLVVARAGASSLAEITAMGRASILMPYPYHKNKHQLANARCLASAKGGSAARIVHDAIDPAINGPALRRVLEYLMASDEVREAMAAAAKRMGRGQAASEIADRIVALAEARGTLPSFTFREPPSDFQGTSPLRRTRNVKDESMEESR